MQHHFETAFRPAPVGAALKRVAMCGGRAASVIGRNCSALCALTVSLLREGQARLSVHDIPVSVAVRRPPQRRPCYPTAPKALFVAEGRRYGGCLQRSSLRLDIAQLSQLKTPHSALRRPFAACCCAAGQRYGSGRPGRWTVGRYGVPAAANGGHERCAA